MKNSEEVNKYYTIINELVDNYLNEWKIKPSNLKTYLKPGSKKFHSFLSKNNLKDVEKADVVLKDILNDREAIEKDGVLTYEKFTIKTDYKFSIIERGIENSTVEHEKKLADYYDTSIGHVDIIDSKKHLFKVESIGDDKECYIWLSDEIEIIKANILDNCLKTIGKESIGINNINMNMQEILNIDNVEKILKEKINKNIVYLSIKKQLNQNLKLKHYSDKFIIIEKL